MNCKIFMIGIKGSGMTPLATLLKKQGYDVVGSDVESHFFTEDFLKEHEIDYYLFNEFDFDSEYTVIVGNSFDDSFSEVVKAKKQNNKIFRYFEYLGELSKNKFSIAVTGTHGKTTTTTISKNIFEFAYDVDYLIGDGNGSGNENSELFIFEACEYKNHFHHYFPNYAIITNVDLDHLDFFTSQEMYNQSYLDFAKNVSNKLFVCGDDKTAYEIFKNHDNVFFYGFQKHSDYLIKDVCYSKSGCKFKIKHREQEFGFDVPIFGKHNVLNFTAAIACALDYGMDISIVNDLYKDVDLPKRRFEEHIYENQIIIDDYAHHPDELEAFLDSVFQKYPDKKVVAVFEPHTVSRLEAHYIEFATQLNRCDMQIVMKVEVPLRDRKLYGDNHIESDIMLKHLNNGYFNPKNLNEMLQSMDYNLILFIGATVSKYSEPYIYAIDLIFSEK